MPFQQTELPGVMIFEPKVFPDGRGYFFESFNARTFAEAGINDIFVQDNQSRSARGVVRGLHYQLAPHAQSKLVRVLSGRIIDVALDVRKGSPTYKKWVACELSAENMKQMYIPRGFAHGFAVLSEFAEVFYKCDDYYCAAANRGIRYDDPTLGIDWGIDADEVILSEKDRVNPFTDEADINFIYGM